MRQQQGYSVAWLVSVACHAGAAAALGGWWSLDDITPPQLGGSRTASIELLGSSPSLAGMPGGDAPDAPIDQDLAERLEASVPLALDAPAMSVPLEIDLSLADMKLSEPPQEASAPNEFAVPRKPVVAATRPRDQREPLKSQPHGNATINSLAAVASAASSSVGFDNATPAVPMRNPLPAYPPGAAARGIEGRLTLRIQIAADGRVTKVEIVASTGHPALDEAAVAAVAQWRFAPARRKGLPIAWSTLLPVRFRAR